MSTPHEIAHPRHPEHFLRLNSTNELFWCKGCEEPGGGARYTCEPCGFDLHIECAVQPGTTLSHPLFGNRTFTFLQWPAPSPMDLRFCNACGKDVNGFNYRCVDGDLDLHPCCARLRTQFTESGRTFSLRNNALNSCSICQQPGGLWFYSSECNTVLLHLACMKEVAYKTRNHNGAHQSNRAVTTGNSYGRIIYRIVGIAIQLVLVDPNIGAPSIATMVAAVVGALFSGQ